MRDAAELTGRAAARQIKRRRSAMAGVRTVQRGDHLAVIDREPAPARKPCRRPQFLPAWKARSYHGGSKQSSEPPHMAMGGRVPAACCCLHGAGEKKRMTGSESSSEQAERGSDPPHSPWTRRNALVCRRADVGLTLEAGRSSQLLAHLLTGLPLAAHLTIAPTITLTLLAQPILVFAGEPELFALASTSPAPTIIYADAAGSDLKCLSRDRGGYKKCRHGKDEGKLAHGTDPCWGEWQRFIPCTVPLDVLTLLGRVLHLAPAP